MFTWRIAATVFPAMLSVLAPNAWAADEVTQPDWLRRPSAEDLRGVWPIEALKKGQGGRATISCYVSTQGLLYDCKVASEDPPGAGFGDAAILMAPQFLMRPMTKDGQPIGGGTVRIPINFKGGGELLGSPHPMVRPNMAWERAPTQAEISAAYPAKAKAAGVTGIVSLQCGFTYLRTLKDCQTLAEAPNGQGFADAARKVAGRFMAPPQRPGGKALSEAVIQISIAFMPDPAKTGEKDIGKPNWIALPSDETLDRAFANMPAGLKTVRVVLHCRVQQGGAVSDCTPTAEEPAGQGFAARALALAPEFRLSTWTMEGLPVVGGVVDIPLRYNAPAPAAPSGSSP